VHGVHTFPYEFDTGIERRVEEHLVEPFAINMNRHGLEPHGPTLQPARRPAHETVTFGCEAMDLTFACSNLFLDQRIAAQLQRVE